MDGKEYRGSTRRGNDTRPIFLFSARMRCICFVHRSSSLSDFQRIFCHRPRSRGNGESTQSSIFRIKKVVSLSASSSLPFHVIVFALIYSNERPYTNPGWPVHSRRRFCYMQEVFFFYARERLAFSPERCVFCFVLAFLSFFLEGNTLRGAWGTSGRVSENERLSRLGR